MKTLRFLWLLPCLAMTACGSRSGLRIAKEEATTDPAECMTAADCEPSDDKCAIVACQAGTCIASARSCDDGDPCTEDSCEPSTGECRNEPLTYDLDGDGHRAPLPGFLPGEPGSCGDDCDDTNPNAFPGNGEVCDGVDNDCNGIVDDGMAYVPADDTDDAILVSGEAAPSYPGGIAFANGSYFAAYLGQVGGKDGAYVTDIGADASVGEPVKLNTLPNEATNGSIVWTGDRFGVVHYNRRPGSGDRHSTHEIIFTTLTAEGKKLGPEVIIYRGINHVPTPPVMTWTGSEFVVVWQHKMAVFILYAQRLDLEGTRIGPYVVLTPGEFDTPNSWTYTGRDDTAPQIAKGRNSLGIIWTRLQHSRRRILFQSFDFELQPIATEPVEVLPKGRNGSSPTIAWNEATQSYLVAYHNPDSQPYAIYGAVVAEDGSLIVPARPITDSPRHSRYPALLPLGDRALLVFSDDKDENQGYELYTKMLDDKLEPLGPELRLTHAPGDSVLPLASFGPNGDIGVLFRDDRMGQQRVWFSRLVCVAGEPL